MSLTLILIRHCKSDWNAGASSDHERPLNARGQADAPRIGAWLAENGLIPDQILCSDATRTRETWDGIVGALPEDATPDVTYSREIYLAEPEAMARAIKGATGQIVAVIAHCPGIQVLAWDLVDMPPTDPDFGSYPTGATTVIDFDVDDWAQIERGTVRAFVTPRKLPHRG